MNLIRLAITRPIFVFMVTAFLVVIGALSLRILPVDLYPDISYPVLSVRVSLDGAAPEEMEQLVAKPLEDALSSLAGIKTMRSTCREGLTFVSLEFDTGVDIKFQEMQVRAKVANIRRSLPDEITEPIVSRQDQDDTPIIEIAVTGNRSASELGQYVEDYIAERIRQIPGVGEVELNGSRQREIHVDLRPEVIEALRLPTSQIIQAIRDFNGNDPIGSLQGTDSTWLLRSTSQIRGVAELRKIPIAKTENGDAVTLNEVAKIYEGFAEVRSVSKFNDGETLRPAILLDVLKQSGENTVAVSDRIKDVLAAVRQELPDDLAITITRDNADLVRTNVADVAETLIIGAILTIAVVLLFLRSPRATITTSLSLPSSVITTFAMMAVAGFTINVMTLMALSLAIGLLVDDAIVVRENIFRHLQNPNIDAKEASYLGTREVSLAVVATTLTIVAVFLPVGFMSGTTGQFFKQFAVTVVFAIMISLWDALTMAPMLSAYFANIADPGREWAALGRIGRTINLGLEKFELAFNRLEHGYKALLDRLLPRPWIALAASFIAVSLAYWGFQIIGKSLLPSQLGTVFSASLSGPQATTQASVNRLADELDRKVSAIPSLDYWSIRTGGGWGNANIRFTVKVKDEFAKSQEDLAKVRADVRLALDGVIGYRLRLSEPADPLSGTSGRFQPVAVLVSGSAELPLRELARKVQSAMSDIKGITDISPLQEDGVPELQIKTLPAFAGKFAINTDDLGRELRTWIEGDTSNKLRLGDERIPIRIRMQDGDQLSPSSLLARSIFVKGRGGEMVAVPIANFAMITPGAGPAQISRENRQKVLRVGANLERGASLGTIVADLQSTLGAMPMPDGYRTRIVGQNEQMSELFRNLLMALALGILFMYMILASLFESFIQPLTVMAAVPLAATGAVLALLMIGLPLDLYGGIAIILLAGIVAKNGILLVDFAMQKVRHQGLQPIQAITETAPTRLRPILMTSAAMIVGMLPVATGLGVGGATRQALGVATIGGIISSTLLTLVVIPSLYIFVENIRAFKFRKMDLI